MKEKIKLGYIGLGRRGFSVLKRCFGVMSDVEIVAVCDTVEDRAIKARDMLTELGRPEPKLLTDYHEMLTDPDIDAVAIMTGWAGRAKLAGEFMLAGKYTAIEVGCAYDISECYDLIDIYEKTKTPLMMLENCCYGRREMMVLNMVRKGLFGDVVHCEGGYHHNLPEVELFKDIDQEIPHYRLASYRWRNCEQYPTHELGPISKVLNINRGNRMMTISSFASRGGGLKKYAAELLGEDSPYAKIDYAQGDIITSIITCAGGETIKLCLDTTLPRPYYSRNFTVRGLDGMYAEERKSVYLKGMPEGAENENNEEKFFETHDHPLHREYAALEKRGGHGGMDYLVCRAFVESVKAGTNTPIDAYDTAAWMSIAPLSEMSIARGGAPIDIPDFTRGKWTEREPVVRGKYCLDEVCEDDSIKIYTDADK